MLKFVRQVIFYFTLYGLTFLVANKLLFTYVHNKIFSEIEYETLIVGDSGTLLLNETDLKHSLNISQAEEIYKVMYYKVKTINKIKPIKNLVIPFSTSNIAILNDKILNGNRHSFEHLKRMYPVANPLSYFMDNTSLPTALEVLTKYVFSLNLEYLKYLFGDSTYTPIYDQKFKALMKRSFPKVPNEEYLKFEYHFSEFLVDNRINHIYYDDDGDVGVSKSSIKYLDKLVSYCIKENINLNLVTLPLTNIYQSKIPQIYLTEFENLKQKYSNMPGVKILDFMNSLSNKQDNHHFKNSDHATRYATSIISRDIYTTISRGS